MTLRLPKNHPTTPFRRWFLTNTLGAGILVSSTVVAEENTPPREPIELPAITEVTAATSTSPSLELVPDEDQDEIPVPVEPSEKEVVPTDFFGVEHHKVMKRVVEFANEQQPIPGNPSPTPANPTAQDGFYQVETKPPTRERLFRVLSPDGYLKQLETDYRNSGQAGNFYLPAPYDKFDSPDSKTLSPLWFQSRKSGTPDPGSLGGLRGFIHVFDNAAQQEVGAPAEVAVINEAIGGPNMSVSVDISLGSDSSSAGIVVHALEPKKWNAAVDQIEQNTYDYVLFTRSSVAIYHHEPGKEDALIKSANVEPKSSFVGVITTIGDQYRVYRDGTQVLEAVDTREMPIGDDAEFCGIIAKTTDGQPTRFDNFIGRRFGGDYSARAFSPSVAMFRGPNVHYNPLYFEQVVIERYGQHLGNGVAPIFAHALFFADAAMLPYSIGKSPPWVCHNDVCYAKPGDLVPFRLHAPAADSRGAFLQATAMALSWSLIP